MTIKEYRVRPDAFRAIQLRRESFSEVVAWTKGIGSLSNDVCMVTLDSNPYEDSKNQKLIAREYQFVVLHPDGHFEVNSPSIFQMKYKEYKNDN